MAYRSDNTFLADLTFNSGNYPSNLSSILSNNNGRQFLTNNLYSPQEDPITSQVPLTTHSANETGSNITDQGEKLLKALLQEVEKHES